MSIHRDLTIVVVNEKTDKDLMDVHIRNVPRIGEGVVTRSGEKKVGKMYRVKDVVWDSYWYNSHSLYHEVRVYVEPEKKKAR
jgi:hypothetical protein